MPLASVHAALLLPSDCGLKTMFLIPEPFQKVEGFSTPEPKSMGSLRSISVILSLSASFLLHRSAPRLSVLPRVPNATILVVRTQCRKNMGDHLSKELKWTARCSRQRRSDIRNKFL